jgi:hypothetical protein
MARRPKPQQTPSEPPRTPATRRQRLNIVHSSVYLPEAVYEALREAAFKERCKIHDIIIEGTKAALKKRGYTLDDAAKAQKRQ